MLNDSVVQGRFDDNSLISLACFVWDPGDSGHNNIYIRVAQRKFDANVVLGRIDVISLVSPARLMTDCLRESNLWEARICLFPKF